MVDNGDAQRNARDSMSPTGIWSEFGGRDVMKYLAFVDQHQDESDGSYQVTVEKQLPPVPTENEATFPIAHHPTANTTTTTTVDTGATTPTPAVGMAEQACEPRSSISRRRRPFELDLDDSRGSTSLSSPDLRSLIRSSSQNEDISLSSRVQVINHDTPLSPITGKGRKKYSQHPPIYGAAVTVHFPQPQQESFRSTEPMGNQHSHHANAYATSHTVAGATYSSSEETESSVDSVMDYSRSRTHKHGHKRASITALKKKLSTNSSDNHLTATCIEVPRAATAPNLDAIEDVDDDEDQERPDRTDVVLKQHVKPLSAPSPATLSHPGSPDTITEESAARPMSAGTTITSYSEKGDTDDIPPGLRVSALSPTIPVPSPVPEDSPHQYGLKDFTNTPSPGQATNSKKSKRRSNGLEMFNNARSLQSAASFLNGLSNARRREESRAGSRIRQRPVVRSNADFSGDDASTANLQRVDVALESSTSLGQAAPPSPTWSSSPPLTPKLDNLSRTLGNTHKSSGFAYAKALSIVQLKCYRNHDRLLRSGNTNHPIECAICHCDEPGDYFWTCSWCAVRMCGGCRLVFRQHGIKALRDKIRFAEMGTVAAST